MQMIAQVWHGWTTSRNADKYKTLLKEEIFVGRHDPQICGFRGFQLLCRDLNHEVEFITIMTFDSLDAAHDFIRQAINKNQYSKRTGNRSRAMDEGMVGLVLWLENWRAKCRGDNK